MRERVDSGGYDRPNARDCSSMAPASVSRSTTSPLSGFALVIIVALNSRGGAGRRRAKAVSEAVRKSWPNLALRFTSNSTSSLPFGGSRSYKAETTARVLTVKSMTD